MHYAVKEKKHGENETKMSKMESTLDYQKYE